jgi:hypothetical protein
MKIKGTRVQKKKGKRRYENEKGDVSTLKRNTTVYNNSQPLKPLTGIKILRRNNRLQKKGNDLYALRKSCPRKDL